MNALIDFVTHIPFLIFLFSHIHFFSHTQKIHTLPLYNNNKPTKNQKFPLLLLSSPRTPNPKPKNKQNHMLQSKSKNLLHSSTIKTLFGSPTVTLSCSTTHGKIDFVLEIWSIDCNGVRHLDRKYYKLQFIGHHRGLRQHFTAIHQIVKLFEDEKNFKIDTQKGDIHLYKEGKQIFVVYMDQVPITRQQDTAFTSPLDDIQYSQNNPSPPKSSPPKPSPNEQLAQPQQHSPIINQKQEKLLKFDKKKLQRINAINKQVQELQQKVQNQNSIIQSLINLMTIMTDSNVFAKQDRLRARIRAIMSKFQNMGGNLNQSESKRETENQKQKYQEKEKEKHKQKQKEKENGSQDIQKRVITQQCEEIFGERMREQLRNHSELFRGEDWIDMTSEESRKVKIMNNRIVCIAFPVILPIAHIIPLTPYTLTLKPISLNSQIGLGLTPHPVPSAPVHLLHPRKTNHSPNLIMLTSKGTIYHLGGSQKNTNLWFQLKQNDYFSIRVNRKKGEVNFCVGSQSVLRIQGCQKLMGGDWRAVLYFGGRFDSVELGGEGEGEGGF